MARALPPEPLVLPTPEKENSWKSVLFVGMLFYVLGIAVLSITRNIKLFPSVIMVGSFLVPITYVVYIYERRLLTQLALPAIALSFFYGGMLGAYAASLLEPLFIRRLTFGSAFEVGLIEEAAKIIGVLVIALHRRHTSEMNGLILGAAAGMGFASVESTGYAFQAFMNSHGSLSQTVGITFFRALVAPFGHGTWTAILAAVLFRESAPRRFRLDLPVVGAYLLVAGLHGLWDGLPGTLMALAVPAFGVLSVQIMVGLTGVFILLRFWHQARNRQITQPVLVPADDPPGTNGVEDI